ncbi:cytochrome P450 [Apiospora phragmitis]|uniref:Cytochrome P450 n=1 Tax=Apiospora phragmitis TaxID=2905665 RepID=A0ABR1T8N0_9PEZI
MYVANDRALISAIERNIRTISFAPIEAQATAAVLATSKATNDIMARDPGSDQNHFAVFRKAVRPILAPGPHLDTMLRRPFHTMSLSLDAQLASAEPIKTNLLAWVRHEITLAGTNAEYGEANPFRDPAIEASWQKFVSGLPVLVGGVLPRVFARESIRARERLVQRFLGYFQQGHHVAEGSAAVHARLRHNAAAGMPPADTARGEVGACLAFVNNTVPAAFWALYHLYADPAVLRDYLDVDRVRSACPILRSTVHEVFRFRGIGTGMVRRVLEDQRLGGGGGGGGGGSGYLLKKGGLVFAASVALRADIRPAPGREWADVTAEKSFGLGIATDFLMPDSDLEVDILSTGNNI